MIHVLKYLFGATLLLSLLARCSPSTPAPAALPPTAEPPPTTKPSQTAPPPTAEPSPTIEASRTAEPSPATYETFTSRRYGYSIEYPGSWRVTERPGEWKSGDLLFQNAAGVDKLSTAGDSKTVVFGAQPVPDGTSLDQWKTTNNEVFLKTFGGGCGEPESETTMLGGEEASTFTYSCSDGYFAIYLYALHNGSGYGAVWVSHRGDETADQETFNKYISSFAFAP